VIGSGGVLDKTIARDQLIVPTSAIRDEGTSYHYYPPSREIALDPDVITQIKNFLERKDIKYMTGKTWTTDAFFRETPEKIQTRKKEGAIIVEMEAAALIAVAKFRQVKLGYILGAGDDVSRLEWDTRGLMKTTGFHEKFFWMAAELAAEF
jgi:uridine phosphorylase